MEWNPGFITKLSDILESHILRDVAKIIVEYCTPADEWALNEAVIRGDYYQVKYLLEIKIDPNKTIRGNLPIREAISNHQYHTVRLLIEGKSKINQKGSFDHLSPLAWIIQNKDSNETIQLLLENHVQIDSLSLQIAIHQSDLKLLTSLMKYHEGFINQQIFLTAVKSKNVLIIKFLLSSKKCQLDSRHLLEAVRTGNIEIVKCLLTAGVKGTRYNGLSPLEEAGKRGDYNMIKLLLNHNSNYYDILDSEYVIATFLQPILCSTIIDIIIRFFGYFGSLSTHRLPMVKGIK